MNDFAYDNGTSRGHSGTDTSEAQARVDRSAQQKALLVYFTLCGAKGLTWFEVADMLDVHHGTASAMLTNMHKKGTIARLSETRAFEGSTNSRGSKVYVLPRFIEGRDTEQYKPRKTDVNCPECGHHFTI